MYSSDLYGIVKIIYDAKLTQMKNNADLQKDVQDAIKWEPLLNAAEIAVIARDGIVTLAGEVNSYLKNLKLKMLLKTWQV
jgi:osmotically-inducible protein OsmY